MEIKDFFEYSHEINNRNELMKTIENLLKDMDDEKLKILLKVIKAVVR